MRSSDWSSDVCSSDLLSPEVIGARIGGDLLASPVHHATAADARSAHPSLMCFCDQSRFGRTTYGPAFWAKLRCRRSCKSTRDPLPTQRMMEQEDRKSVV